MRIIKLIIISFIVIFLVITGISLFIPSNIRISKAIDINTTYMYDVAEQLLNSENWKNWCPAQDTLAIFGTDYKKMFEQEIDTSLSAPRNLPDHVIFSYPSSSHSRKREMGWNIIPGSTPNDVTVQWYMDFHLRWYPWEKFRSLLFEKTYGVQMEKGLANLKAWVEK